jgi:hypothetical protein
LIINQYESVELTGLYSNIGGLAVLSAEHQSSLNINDKCERLTDFNSTYARSQRVKPFRYVVLYSPLAFEKKIGSRVIL